MTKRFLDGLAVVLAVLIGAAVIGGCFYLHFHVWRLLHPTAPVWTYIVRGGK